MTLQLTSDDEEELRDVTALTSAQLTPGEKVSRWIRRRCLVPEGKLLGQPFVLEHWQQRIINKIYNNPHGTRRAIISFGRKNGKTTLAAVLLLNHLCGPRAVRNSQLFSAAQSREQAAVLFHLAAKMVRMNSVLRNVVMVKDSAKELLCPELGTRYRALSADASTAYGLSPAFIVHDELGLVRGPRSALYEALETATGAQEAPLSVIISTQAPTDADLLSILIDDAEAGHDRRTVMKVFTASQDADPFILSTIKRANPALGAFLSRDEVLGMAAAAKRMPARESEYRNLILNQRVHASTPFVAPAVWAANASPPAPFSPTTLVCAGLDLSEVQDLTALVLIGCVNGIWQVHPTFWLPQDGLLQKATSDRVPYDLWAQQGHLQLSPGKVISYQYVAKHLLSLFQKYNIQKLAFDRWNFKHLKPWLLEVGFSEQMIVDHFVEFGQGWASMSPALRELEQALVERKVAHGHHPVLTMCVNHTTITTDDAGNRKPSKRRSTGRIDGLVAMAMAFGVAPEVAKPVDINALIG